MSDSRREIVIFLVLLAVGMAHAQETGCTTPLSECTKTRVAQLKSQSRALASAARQKPGKTVSDSERAQLDQYDRWLKKQSRQTLELATRGSAATQPEAQMSFNLQYLQLQSQMQSENRSYTAVSNIMKTKHDTVKNSISNVRCRTVALKA